MTTGWHRMRSLVAERNWGATVAVMMDNDTGSMDSIQPVVSRTEHLILWTPALVSRLCSFQANHGSFFSQPLVLNKGNVNVSLF